MSGDRDLTALATGDSVVWGQGLAHDEKFVSRAYRRLTGETLPEEAILARSGSIIDRRNADSNVPDPKDEVDHYGRTAVHEYPYYSPVVPEQLASVSADEAADVDLLFLDGGANDVGLLSLANPLSRWPALEEATRTACFTSRDPPRPRDPNGERGQPPDLEFEGFLDLLYEAGHRFPNATVVVTGYYPAFTPQTREGFLDELAEAGLGTLGALYYQFVPYLSWIGALVGGVLGDAAVTRIVQNVEYFHRRQLHWLRRAVDHANQDPDFEGGHVVFAHAGYQPENGVDAGQSWVTSPFDTDAQRAERAPLCRDLIEWNPKDELLCENAAAFHPNAAGARAYADEIVRRYEDGDARSLRDELTDLRGGRERSTSTRAQFNRYNLPQGRPEPLRPPVKDAAGPRRAPGAFRVGANLDHVEVDVIEVTVKTGDNGTNSDVYLRVNDDLRWQLDREWLEKDQNDFERWTEATYTIDPVYEGMDRPLELGDIEELTLVKEETWAWPTAWRPAHVSVALNGVEVFDSDVGELLRGDDEWVGHYPRSLVIDEIQADAPGVPEDDNLDEEYVVVRNVGDDSLWLDGYRLDYGDGRGYRFPHMGIEPGMRVTVRTGVGEDDGTDRYAGYRHAVLHNEHDVVTLEHEQSGVVDRVVW